MCYKAGKKFDYPLCLSINQAADCISISHKDQKGLSSAPDQVGDNVSSISSQIMKNSSLAIGFTLQTESKWIRSVEIRCPKSAIWVEDNFIILFGDLIQNYFKCFESRLDKQADQATRASSGEMEQSPKALYIEFLHIGELNLEGLSYNMSHISSYYMSHII